MAINWDGRGGGPIAVLPLNERPATLDAIPLLRGHTAAVLDTDWYVFSSGMISLCHATRPVLIFHSFSLLGILLMIAS